VVFNEVGEFGAVFPIFCGVSRGFVYGQNEKKLTNHVSKVAGMSVIIKTQCRPGDIWLVVLGFRIEPGS
jgi:hypothetical protein